MNSISLTYHNQSIAELNPLSLLEEMSFLFIISFKKTTRVDTTNFSMIDSYLFASRLSDKRTNNKQENRLIYLLRIEFTLMF